MRDRTTARTRSQSGTDSSSTTEVMTIRLVGRSMLSHSESTALTRRRARATYDPASLVSASPSTRWVVHSSRGVAPRER